MNIGYARVSCESQNLDRQLETFKKLGIEQIFTDKISGAKFERPGLIEMLKFVREDDHVYVSDFCRMARNVGVQVKILEILKEKKVKITFLRENITMDCTSSPMTKFISHFFSCVAEWRRDEIREAQEQGIKLAKERKAFKGSKKNLSKYLVEKLKVRRNAGFSYKELQEEFGISEASVWRYLNKYEI